MPWVLIVDFLVLMQDLHCYVRESWSIHIIVSLPLNKPHYVIPYVFFYIVAFPLNKRHYVIPATN